MLYSSSFLTTIKRVLIVSLFLVVFFILVFTPFTALATHNAWHPLVPCGITDQALLSEDSSLGNPCGFDGLIELVRRIISFIIMIAVPFAAIAFAWAGALLLTSAGDPGKISQAKEILWNVFWGLAIVLAAWLIVNSIAGSLLNENFLESQLWFLEK